MNNVKNVVLVLAAVCAVGLSSCKKDPANAVHDADWYLANGTELGKKLNACKADPVAAKADAECTAATSAFLRWYAASGQQAAQTSKDASIDSRLTPPTADAAAPAPDANGAPSDAPVQTDPSAPAAEDPSKTTP